MAGTLRTVLKLLVGESREDQPAGCSLTALLVPKGPSFDPTLAQIRSETGLNPEAFTALFRVKSEEGKAESTVTALRQAYDTHKGDLGLGQRLETAGLEVSFEAVDGFVLVKLRLNRHEALSAMLSMAESMLPEVFSQASKVALRFTTVKDLSQSSASDLQFLYSLFEGSRLELTLELWRGLFQYLRERTKEIVTNPDLTKALAVAGIYARGNVELKLRGAHAIPVEIREKIASFSTVLEDLRTANQSDALVNGLGTALRSDCLAVVDIVAMTPLFVLSAQLQAPGLSGVFLKPS